jgi:FMN phosphatase YigB (HAD superfamily)|tara:strand:+ start:660 stop:1310 length:651 start_codon:yes stop_codon:yes gene_type:complete
MTKFNSTTAILSDLDGVILDLNYDMKFWQDWLPDALTLSSGKTRSDIKAELVAMMKNQEASLNWYDLNYWDEYFKVDCLEIIKAQEERCSFLDGSVDALNKFAALPNPKYILTNGDPRLFDFKSESANFLDYFDSHLCSMHVGYAKEQKEFWSLASQYLKLDLKNSIFIDDNFKVVTSAVKAGVGQVYWINKGRSKVLSNGVITYPTLAELVSAIL